MLAKTPEPPYYAVIFTSIRSSEDNNGYVETAKRMLELAGKQEGFLGFETAREEIGITVSYWKDLKSIKTWKANVEHSGAREKGRSTWYKCFKTRIALVEKDYGFEV